MFWLKSPLVCFYSTCILITLTLFIIITTGLFPLSAQKLLQGRDDVLFIIVPSVPSPVSGTQSAYSKCTCYLNEWLVNIHPIQPSISSSFTVWSTFPTALWIFPMGYPIPISTLTYLNQHCWSFFQVSSSLHTPIFLKPCLSPQHSPLFPPADSPVGFLCLYPFRSCLCLFIPTLTLALAWTVLPASSLVTGFPSNPL